MCNSISIHSNPQNIIMFGEPEILQTVRHRFPSLLLELDPHTETHRENPVCWGRDWRVITPNGMHCIPYAIKVPTSQFLRALIPSDDRMGESTLFGLDAGHGSGIDIQNRKRAITYAQASDIAYGKTLSSVEGGNCFIFRTSEDTVKAIIGNRSLLLTWIGLHEQGYFTKNQAKLQRIKANIHSPSDESIRVCRNLAIHALRKKSDQIIHECDQSLDKIYNHKLSTASSSERTKIINELHTKRKEATANILKHFTDRQYFRKLLEPLNPGDFITYKSQAIDWDAEIEMAKQVICRDLGISIINTTFVPHFEHFHIDMFMFVAPNGTVCVDPSIICKPSFVNALHTINCVPVPLHGVLREPTPMNFMNGLFVSSSPPVFVVEDAPEHQEEARHKFDNEFQKIFPGGEVFHIPGTSRLSASSGSIRCLTWEKPAPYQSIIDIVVRFLVNEPSSSQRINAALHNSHASALFVGLSAR